MKRVLIRIFGCVQGVGFRPFVYRLALKWNLVGSIKNTTSGVEIDVQGPEKSLNHFYTELQTEKPSRSSIDRIEFNDTPLHEVTSFSIMQSQSQSNTALALLPDSSICDLCLQELFDPENRRYLYPFLHCMECGPRFSLFTAMPFDRRHTTMSAFTMCEACQQEYDDPSNRRFYSQTNCCPACGPELQLLDSEAGLVSVQGDAIEQAVHALQKGKIVAAKNTGGYLLLVDASNEEAVQRLRELKNRPKKPLALLLKNIEEAGSHVQLCSQGKSVLCSPAAPIVLFPKKEDTNLAPSIAPDNPYLGIMLPHNALQILLLEEAKLPLVATSGNLSGHPLCIEEKEAFLELEGIADYFLIHNRKIHNRLDDSLVHIINNRPVILRRARGYIPIAFSIPDHLQHPCSLFAAGSQLKNTFALSTPSTVYLSQHFGDLDSASSCISYDHEVMKWQHLLSIEPTEGIGDKHPDYYTSRYLEKRGFKAAALQHHEAHIWAGMLDTNLTPPFLAFAWDGTGYGDDHTIWGGEAFVVTEESIERFATLLPFPLPGGEQAVREPRRSALGLLHTLFEGDIPGEYNKWLDEAFNPVEQSILSSTLAVGFNCPACSSMGRLFDAASALLTKCFINQYEAEAPLTLEGFAMKASRPSSALKFPFKLEHDLIYLDWRPVLHELLNSSARGVSLSTLAASFHLALVNTMVALAKTAKLKQVLMTGGVFQNKFLTELATERLKKAGYTPRSHEQIPPNDGGVAVGQLIGTLFHHTRSSHVPSCSR